MNTVWIGLIGTLSGVLIGGIVSYFVSYAQFKRDKQLKEEQIVQQKLEEICKTAEEINTSYNTIMGEVMMFVQFGRKMKIDISPIPLNKLKMLIYFYAPSLKKIYNQLEETARLHAEGMVSIIKDTTDDKKAILVLIIKITQLLTNHCTALIESSANIVRSHFISKDSLYT